MYLNIHIGRECGHLKNISITHITIIGIKILLGEGLVVCGKFSTTHATHVSIIINIQWRKDIIFDFSSWTAFILLKTHDFGLDGMDVSVNYIFYFLIAFLLPILALQSIVKIFELAVC